MHYVNWSRQPSTLWLSAAVVIYAVSATAQESYSPNVNQHHPARVYWGDTHLHTNLSNDAFIYGNRLTSTDAYRFARGEEITASNGMKARLQQPLDFLVVADHAEELGVIAGLGARNSLLAKTAESKNLMRYFEESAGKSPSDPSVIENMRAVGREVFSPYSKTPVARNEAFEYSIWKEVTAAADRNNKPGRFTAFIGYEWSGGRPWQGVLHRVVIFRDAAHLAGRVVPFSSNDSGDPEALWAHLESYEEKTGGQVLAIPHNGNQSMGKMFPLTTLSGLPVSRSYAERRGRWEPLFEITQIKGTSEAHPFLFATDEFADYEIWNGSDGKALPAGRSWDEQEKIIKAGEYARSGLKRGLNLHAELGVNPYKFGFAGGTDAHTSLSAVAEDNFWGKVPPTNPGPKRSTNEYSIGGPISSPRGRADAPVTATRGWHMGASGYTAVWATENTREALFAAMKRRETYASTGPRMTVRFFGGWDFETNDAFNPNLALMGYRKGVPMGGDLTHAPAGKRPRFLIRATKDPEGAHLDRIQVIKGWVDKNDETHEKIYNVALSDGRREGKGGKVPPVGSTVDVPNASYTNTIGDAELAVVWTDPHFDVNELAFYYLRVLEIPTPRWTAYDAKFFAIKEVPAEVPMVIQERAYTSPIWYTP